MSVVTLYLPEGDVAVSIGVCCQVTSIRSKGHCCDWTLMTMDVLQRDSSAISVCTLTENPPCTQRFVMESHKGLYWNLMKNLDVCSFSMLNSDKTEVAGPQASHICTI